MESSIVATAFKAEITDIEAFHEAYNAGLKSVRDYEQSLSNDITGSESIRLSKAFNDEVVMKFNAIMDPKVSDEEILRGLTLRHMNEPRNLVDKPFNGNQCNAFTLAWYHRRHLAKKMMLAGLVDVSYMPEVDFWNNTSPYYLEKGPDYAVMFTAAFLYDSKCEYNMLDFLVECGVDINIRDANGRNILWFLNGQYDLFNTLKSMYAKGYITRDMINAQDSNGHTILSQIITKSESWNSWNDISCYPLIELFVQLGADLSLDNCWESLMNMKADIFYVKDNYEWSPKPCRKYKSRDRKYRCLCNCISMSLIHGYVPKYTIAEINRIHPHDFNFDYDYENTL